MVVLTKFSWTIASSTCSGNQAAFPVTYIQVQFAEMNQDRRACVLFPVIQQRVVLLAR